MAAPPRLWRHGFRAMASAHEIVLASDSETHARSVAEAAIAEVARIEAKYSRFRDSSLVSAINRAAGGAPIRIDAETAALLDYADACHRESRGRFDITSGVLRRAWDFRREPPRVASQREIDALLPLVGWNGVERDAHAIRLPRAGMEIDLGGIGKEYAADRAAALAIDGGIAQGLVNLAGDVRVWGGLPDGRPWRVGIRHPRTEGATIAGIELADGAVATSGDYERCIVVDGRRYCHVLDATTGWPVDGWQSMSVVAPLCVVAGSGATVGMLLGEEAPRWLASEGFRWLGVDVQGVVRET
ncbi:MAG: FAD:protein FMN transferase [Burkholderiales bacterium]|jgi:thiamine biosynthesis lipoprotein|nr:FAD:protein FMN transferase [Burkholderiales bacterium]